ncbi:TPA: hypothetical protein P5J50_001799 [Legionella pneumophila]|nr:hypothetical protein [Legionella pneumophila]HDO7884500.1 hypothetical protein [Legionella pneumophila]HDO8047171.1 hypothetical protein [Legionella pneumophila]HDO8055437.1 hypothetical protein [Legionella pneumophila]HDO8149250.1 hypothetical protein [Legionella pneumophila]
MEQMISLIFSVIKFVLNQFKEIIKIGMALAVIAIILFALSYPFTLIDNYFSSNSTYKKITANLGEFSSTLFKTVGCGIVPGLCISLEELSAKLKKENLIFDSLNTEENTVCNKPVIQHTKEENLLQKNLANNAHNSVQKPNRLYVKEGQFANIFVKKQFDLPSSNNQGIRTIPAGTVISGITLTSFYATEKPSQAKLKLVMDSTSCIAVSDTQVNPDYESATAIAKIISLNCSHDKSKNIAIEAIASIPGMALYPKGETLGKL